MSFTRTPAAEIYWKLEGEEGAPPLVLLNAIGCDMDLWAEALPALRRRFSVLRIDTRGHGASKAMAGFYTLGMLARDVNSVMNDAGFRSAAIAGVSLGGMVAMQLALERPARVRALVLACTSATMDRTAWAQRVGQVQAEGMVGVVDLAMGRFLSPDFAARRPEAAATVRRGLSSMSPAGYAGCAAAIRDMALAERLGEIAVPSLVVTGTQDASTPHEPHGEYLCANLPRARHAALACGHLAPLEAGPALADIMIDFLET